MTPQDNKRGGKATRGRKQSVRRTKPTSTHSQLTNFPGEMRAQMFRTHDIGHYTPYPLPSTTQSSYPVYPITSNLPADLYQQHPAPSIQQHNGPFPIHPHPTTPQVAANNPYHNLFDPSILPPNLQSQNLSNNQAYYSTQSEIFHNLVNRNQKSNFCSPPPYSTSLPRNHFRGIPENTSSYSAHPENPLLNSVSVERNQFENIADNTGDQYNNQMIPSNYPVFQQRSVADVTVHQHPISSSLDWGQSIPPSPAAIGQSPVSDNQTYQIPDKQMPFTPRLDYNKQSAQHTYVPKRNRQPTSEGDLAQYNALIGANNTSRLNYNQNNSRSELTKFVKSNARRPGQYDMSGMSRQIGSSGFVNHQHISSQMVNQITSGKTNNQLLNSNVTENQVYDSRNTASQITEPDFTANTIASATNNHLSGWKDSYMLNNQNLVYISSETKIAKDKQSSTVPAFYDINNTHNVSKATTDVSSNNSTLNLNEQAFVPVPSEFVPNNSTVINNSTGSRLFTLEPETSNLSQTRPYLSADGRFDIFTDNEFEKMSIITSFAMSEIRSGMSVNEPYSNFEDFVNAFMKSNFDGEISSKKEIKEDQSANVKTELVTEHDLNKISATNPANSDSDKTYIELQPPEYESQVNTKGSRTTNGYHSDNVTSNTMALPTIESDAGKSILPAPQLTPYSQQSALSNHNASDSIQSSLTNPPPLPSFSQSFNHFNLFSQRKEKKQISRRNFKQTNSINTPSFLEFPDLRDDETFRQDISLPDVEDFSPDCSSRDSDKLVIDEDSLAL